MNNVNLNSNELPKIRWIGDVPISWKIIQLRRISGFVDYRGKTPEKVENGVPLITAKNIRNGKIDNSISREYMREDEYVQWMVRGWPKKGDVLVTTEAPLGEVAQVTDEHIALAQRIILIKADKSKIFNDYLKYYLMSHAGQGELWTRATGSTALGIKADRLKDILTIIPPIKTQKLTVSFLDDETSRIDALIEKKERQIELLKEKRSAIISHVVTKGLNPDAKMKDSGVEWLGKVPNHWPIYRSKVIFREVNERSTSGEEELLTVSHISGVTRRSEKNVNMFMAESLEGYKKCNKGDLIINTMWAWMGAMGIASEPGIVSPSYNVYRLRNNSNVPSYFDYLVRTGSFIAEATRFSKGIWSSRLRLYPESFFEIQIPCPQKDEQKIIVASLAKKIGEYSKISDLINISINKLKEYRAAIITAAVTGQIDIRKEAA